MTLHVVEKPPDPFAPVQCYRYRADLLTGRFSILGPLPTFEVRDASARDGEWHAVVTLPHEIVEHDGHAVPAFEGDLERIEWERRRRRA